MNIPFLSLGGSGPPLPFLHANGYPPECYFPLFTRLSENYHIFSMRQRPLWPDAKPEEIADWRPLTDDFLRFLNERQTGSSIAIGHSVGGNVVLRAALLNPERFRALILIDPVLFPPIIVLLWRIICSLGLSYKLHPLIRAARHRRHHFNDLERLFKGYRQKQIFRYMDNPALHAYVEGITCPEESGYKLCYSPEWEMRIYATSVWRDMDIWHGLPRLKIPLLIIRGEETDTFWASTGRRIQQIDLEAKIVTVTQATHLVPLERPETVFQIISEFLQENV
jgi:pimeloyl-ACP methyl ester carboxylesterase